MVIHERQAIDMGIPSRVIRTNPISSPRIMVRFSSCIFTMNSNFQADRAVGSLGSFSAASREPLLLLRCYWFLFPLASAAWSQECLQLALNFWFEEWSQEVQSLCKEGSSEFTLTIDIFLDKVVVLFCFGFSGFEFLFVSKRRQGSCFGFFWWVL